MSVYKFDRESFKMDIDKFMFKSECTLSDISKLCDLSVNTLWRMKESDSGGINMNTFVSICNVIGKSPKKYFV